MLQSPRSHEQHDEKGGHDNLPDAGKSKSSASSQDDLEAIDRASFEPYEAHEEVAKEKPAPRVSLELKRTASRASNILERVLTTRSITDPGPPPDGGLQAWTQVACGWLVIFTTWGWINSFGVWQTYVKLSSIHLGHVLTPTSLNLGTIR